MSASVENPVTLERIPMEEPQNENPRDQERRKEVPPVRRLVPEEERRRMVREAMRLLSGKSREAETNAPKIREKADDVLSRVC